MINSSKNIFRDSPKFQICFLGLGSRQTGFMWGNTFNTLMGSIAPIYALSTTASMLWIQYLNKSKRVKITLLNYFFY